MVDRRNLVTFDPDHFAKQSAPPDALEAFRYAHANNLWNGPETQSGPGSSHEQTETVVRALPVLLRDLGVRRLLDVPCGEFHWMGRVDLTGVAYVGGDLVPEVVAQANAAYGSPTREFIVVDLRSDPLPATDLLLCRDCFVHLSFADIERVLANIRAAGIPYLLTTTFIEEPTNRDVVTGDWRPLNMERPPFSFPPPAVRLIEGCTEQDGAFADKALGLWEVADLPVVAGGSA